MTRVLLCVLGCEASARMESPLRSVSVIILVRRHPPGFGTVYAPDVLLLNVHASKARPVGGAPLTAKRSAAAQRDTSEDWRRGPRGIKGPLLAPAAARCFRVACTTRNVERHMLYKS